MAKLKLDDPVGLGEYVRKMLKDPKEKLEFLNDANSKVAPFLEDGVVPKGVQIVPHFDTEHTTHMMIPWSEDVVKTEVMVEAGDYGYPEGYFRLDPKSSESDERQEAYNFRVGDYVLARCG